MHIELQADTVPLFLTAGYRNIPKVLVTRSAVQNGISMHIISWALSEGCTVSGFECSFNLTWRSSTLRNFDHNGPPTTTFNNKGTGIGYNTSFIFCVKPVGLFEFKNQ